MCICIIFTVFIKPYVHMVLCAVHEPEFDSHFSPYMGVIPLHSERQHLYVHVYSLFMHLAPGVRAYEVATY